MNQTIMVRCRESGLLATFGLSIMLIAVCAIVSAVLVFIIAVSLVCGVLSLAFLPVLIAIAIFEPTSLRLEPK